MNVDRIALLLALLGPVLLPACSQRIENDIVQDDDDSFPGDDDTTSGDDDTTSGDDDTTSGDDDTTSGDDDTSGAGSDELCQASPMLCWPNAVSYANSDPWLSQNHDALVRMRPRFLLINFANGLGQDGNNELLPGSAFTQSDLEAKAVEFLDLLSEASRYQPSLNPGAPSFLEPKLVRVVDLQDNNGHANSDAFPRGQVISDTPAPGYRTVGYYQLFSEAFAANWGYYESGRYLTLAEIVAAGYVHDVIMMANQVDGRAPNPPAEVTANILEVAFAAQVWDQNLDPVPGEYVKNGIPHDRQKVDMASATEHDHNSMPWPGRSLRIYFLNASRGVGCLAHSLGHEFEFRYNEARLYSPGSPHHEQSVNPYIQPKFRAFADFDMDSRYGAPFDSLYAGGDDYSYSNCDSDGVCDSMIHPDGTISTYRPVCGNTHYPPGATYGYDYMPVNSVRSSCESYGKQGGQAEVFNSGNWDYLTNNPNIDGDCGGKFLTYWCQNMPGLDNDAWDGATPMKNWWPFMYY